MSKVDGPVRIEGNPAVNRKILQEAAAITKQLEDYGLEPRPRYNLEPPFGGKIVSNPPLKSQQTQPRTSHVEPAI